MLDRLEPRRCERERRFVADASHELRTPLAILKTELELALRADRRPQTSSSARSRSAAEETDRLAQLAEDLLLLARADEGRLPVRPRAVDVASCSTRSPRRFARVPREPAARSRRRRDRRRRRRRSDAPRAGARQPGRQRAAPRRRHRSCSSRAARERRRRAARRRRGPRLPAGLPRARVRALQRAPTSARARGGTGLGPGDRRAIARGPRRRAPTPRTRPRRRRRLDSPFIALSRRRASIDGAMTKNRSLILPAVLLGVALLVVAVIYWVDSASALPSFFPRPRGRLVAPPHQARHRGGDRRGSAASSSPGFKSGPASTGQAAPTAR